MESRKVSEEMEKDLYRVLVSLESVENLLHPSVSQSSSLLPLHSSNGFRPF